jgi:hypothetical protein
MFGESTEERKKEKEKNIIYYSIGAIGIQWK